MTFETWSDIAETNSSHPGFDTSALVISNSPRNWSRGLPEPQGGACPVCAVLRRISAVAAASAEPVASRARLKPIAKPARILVIAVLYYAAGPGLKQSREAGSRSEERRVGKERRFRGV